MKPNYIARKSVLPSLSVWLILFFWLIVPTIIQIFRILAARAYIIEFYDDKIITRSGVLNKTETQSVFMGVYSITVSQTFAGRLVNCGDVRVDCPGKWDIDTTGIADPYALKKYLETKITAKGSTNVIYN